MKNKFGLLVILGFLLISGCNRLYKAGNLETLSYPVETSLRTKVVQMYLDTLIAKHGYKVPDKWLDKDKLVEFDSVNNKRIYFSSDPEEMYLISYPGMLILADVYNPKIVQQYWVANRNLMPRPEEERVKHRFKTEILDKVERMAKQDNLPDSVIYKD